MHIEGDLQRFSRKQDQESVHAAVACAGSAYYSNVVKNLGTRGGLPHHRENTYSLSGTDYNLVKSDLINLMWHSAVALR